MKFRSKLIAKFESVYIYGVKLRSKLIAKFDSRYGYRYGCTFVTVAIVYRHSTDRSPTISADTSTTKRKDIDRVAVDASIDTQATCHPSIGRASVEYLPSIRRASV